MIYAIVDLNCMTMTSDDKNYSPVPVGIMQTIWTYNDDISHSEWLV